MARCGRVDGLIDIQRSTSQGGVGVRVGVVWYLFAVDDDAHDDHQHVANHHQHCGVHISDKGLRGRVWGEGGCGERKGVVRGCCESSPALCT